jgi:organic hydroperoxide reductase OsmC/OhrA
MTHTYVTQLTWIGNLGHGTSSYAGYERRYLVRAPGKPELVGSSDPAYRGEADKHNPEDLFLAALAACHMLFYLSLCARRGVRVLAYEDRATGTLVTRADGGGRFESVTLSPIITIADESDEALATALHETAGSRCFIASSCSVPVRYLPTVRRAHATAAAEPSALPVNGARRARPDRPSPRPELAP